MRIDLLPLSLSTSDSHPIPSHSHTPSPIPQPPTPTQPSHQSLNSLSFSLSLPVMSEIHAWAAVVSRFTSATSDRLYLYHIHILEGLQSVRLELFTLWLFDLFSSPCSQFALRFFALWAVRLTAVLIPYVESQNNVNSLC